MAKIWVTGEALIDFIPTSTQHGAGFALRCGGSTYNAAKAAARMGADARFVGAISIDMFGQRLADDLVQYGVNIADAPRVDLPSTLAFVEYHGVDARYAFFNNRSATQCTDMRSCKAQIEAADYVHAGSISLIDAPGADSITDFILALPAEVMVSLDPNVRAGMIADVAGWRARIGRLMSRANVIKLSDEDLAYMRPGQAYAAFAIEQIAAGCGLVAVTLAERGIYLATSQHQAHIPAQQGRFADTVGAGDTVTGALLADLCGRNVQQAQDFAAISAEGLRDLGQRAMAAAWLNCQSHGCQPPFAAEVDALLAQGEWPRRAGSNAPSNP